MGPGTRWPGGAALALVLALVVAGLSGCALFTGRAMAPRDLAGTIAPRRQVPGVPIHRQTEYHCGPAALAMLLAWGGRPVAPASLVAELLTPARRGTLTSAMVAAVRRRERVPYPVTRIEDLLAEIAAGHPVMVLENRGLPGLARWHYAVGVGYDLDDETIWFHDGRAEPAARSLRGFNTLWGRSGSWGLLVLPPERLPARVTEDGWVKALAGLETAGRWETAARGYEAALERWPASLGAWMGLGNALYAQGHLEKAAAAFEAAVGHHPAAASAHNNLAHVYGRLGRGPEALAAARRAVALGGPLEERHRETLEELERAAP
jgi:hypothetical protein